MLWKKNKMRDTLRDELEGLPVCVTPVRFARVTTKATGGYLVGMLVSTYLLGLLANRRMDQRFLTSFPAMICGTLTTFTFGLLWLAHFTGKDWAWTINAGLTPFIIGEIFKIMIAGTSMPLLWRIVNAKSR